MILISFIPILITLTFTPPATISSSTAASIPSPQLQPHNFSSSTPLKSSLDFILAQWSNCYLYSTVDPLQPLYTCTIYGWSTTARSTFYFYRPRAKPSPPSQRLIPDRVPSSSPPPNRFNSTHLNSSQLNPTPRQLSHWWCSASPSSAFPPSIARAPWAASPIPPPLGTLSPGLQMRPVRLETSRFFPLLLNINITPRWTSLLLRLRPCLVTFTVVPTLIEPVRRIPMAPILLLPIILQTRQLELQLQLNNQRWCRRPSFTSSTSE